MRLRADARDLADLHAAVLALAPREGAAFLAVEASGGGLVLHSWRAFGPDELEFGPSGEVSIHEPVQLSALADVKAKGHLLVEVHTHPGSRGSPRFSPYDDEHIPAFARYVRNKLGRKGYGAIVLSERGYCGRWIRDLAEVSEPLVLQPVGELPSVPEWATHEPVAAPVEDRFDRQLRALGPVGQRRMASLSVGVVGLGGTGSQVVQQLAHLGVSDFLLVEDDVVEASNLPRLAGATLADAHHRVRKQRIAQRMIAGLNPHASMRCTGSLRTAASLASLVEVDLVLGCVDNDGARLILAELASAHLVPYLDIGVGIEDPKGAIGGRIASQVPKGACLACADEIDFDEAGQDLETEEQARIRHEHGYARDRRIEAALMPLNTVVVGAALMEVLAYVTGMRALIPFLRYDAVTQALRMVNVAVNVQCPVCRPGLGMGDRALVSRYALSGPNTSRLSG